MNVLEIAELVRTQDNRITAEPVFAVQQRKRIYGLTSDYAEKFIYVDSEGCEHTEREEEGLRKVWYRDDWEFVTACFTEQGCKDFIAVNGHNLTEPRIYAYSGYRNYEWITLREHLKGLK